MLSRTQTVVLDASASEPASHGLHVTWSDRDATVADAPWTHLGEGLTAEPLSLAFTHVRDFVDGEPPHANSGRVGSAVREIRAEVRDPVTGGVATFSATRQFVNLAPRVEIERLLEYPTGGKWWEDGAPYEATLRPALTDADDGEVLSFGWTRVAVPAGLVLSTSAEGGASFDVPRGPASLVFDLSASDGNGATTSARVEVRVHNVIWSVEQDGALRRVIDPDVTVSADGNGWVVGVVDDADPGIAAGMVWTAEKEGDPTSTWSIFLRTPGAGTEVRHATGFAAGSYVDGRDMFLGGDVASDGGAWIALQCDDPSPGGEVDRLFRMNPNGTLAFAQVLAARPLVGQSRSAPRSLLAGPNDGLWVLAGVETAATLALLDASGGLVAEAALDQAPMALASGIVSDGADGVWALLANASEASVSTELLRLGLVDGAVVELERHVVPVQQALAFAGDPLRDRFAFLARPDGEPARIAVLASDLGTILTQFEGTATTVEFDPLDGAIWALATGATSFLVRFDDRGTALRSIGDLSSFNPPGRPLRVNPTSGTAWLADWKSPDKRLLGVSGVVAPSVESQFALLNPDTLALDPEGSRIVVGSRASGAFARYRPDGSVETVWDLSDFGVSGDAGAMTVDPATGEVWFAARFGGRVWKAPRDPSAAVMEMSGPGAVVRPILSMNVDPVTGEVCVGGRGTGGTRSALARFTREGTLLWSGEPLAFDPSIVLWVGAGADGSCAWFAHDESADPPQGHAGRFEAGGNPGPQKLFSPALYPNVFELGPFQQAPDGTVYFLEKDPGRLRKLELAMPDGIVVDLTSGAFRNPRTFAVHPVDGSFYVGVGPLGSDLSPPMVLHHTAAGLLLGYTPSVGPTQLVVNR